MKKTFADYFRENMGYILSALVVITYVATALMGLSETQKTVQQIIVDSFIILSLGITLSQTLGQQGLNEGDKNEDVKKTKEDNNAAQLRTQPFWFKANTFCQIKNKTALYHERERILNMNALKYEDYFDKDARYIGKLFDIKGAKKEKKMLKRKNKAINYVTILKITQITPSDLITETVKKNDPLGRGRTIKEYRTQTAGIDIVMKVATAILGGLYTAQFLGADWGEIIYRIVLAVILLAFGIVKYYSNYRFIITENRSRIATSTHWLDEFETMNNAGMLDKKKETKPKATTKATPKQKKKPS